LGCLLKGGKAQQIKKAKKQKKNEEFHYLTGEYILKLKIISGFSFGLLTEGNF